MLSKHNFPLRQLVKFTITMWCHRDVIDRSVFPRVEDHLECKGTVSTLPRDGTKRPSEDRVRSGQRVSRAAQVYRRGIYITADNGSALRTRVTNRVYVRSLAAVSAPSLVLSLSLSLLRFVQALEKGRQDVCLPFAFDINSKFYYFRYSIDSRSIFGEEVK
jgi:hypothetical protein